jgi:molecular chaperone DnaJ
MRINIRIGNYNLSCKGCRGLKGTNFITLFKIALLKPLIPLIPLQLFSIIPALMSMNPYEILGVTKGASTDDIKKAYRKKSKELHPDKHPGDKQKEEDYKKINEAYEILKDPKKKQFYDQYGSTSGPGGGAGGFGGGFGGAQGFDFSDLGGFNDIFEQFFSGGGAGGRRGGRRQQRGEDLEVELTLELEDVLTETKRDLTINRLEVCKDCDGSGAEAGSEKVTCDECNGTGQVVRTSQSVFGMLQQAAICPTCRGEGEKIENPCSNCRGEGRKQTKANVTVSIPAGIHDGQTLKVGGEGNAGPRGASSGDLYVHIRVRNHSTFVRDGNDVRTTAIVPVVDAILGTEITVKTVQGDVTLKVPNGTQPNQIFRLKGKGLPVLQRNANGDHYVTVVIEIPKKLNKKEKKVLEEWRQLV